MTDDTKTTIAVLGFAFGVGGAGWSAYLGTKVGSLSALWKWKDDFIEKYNENRLADAKEYATQENVDKSMATISENIKSLDHKIDTLTRILLKQGGPAGGETDGHV